MQFNASEPIYLQIADFIKRKIVSGEWALSDKVPPVRELALAMGVNPNTIQKAVAALEDEGLLHAERTSGRYVTRNEAAIAKAKQEMTAAEIEGFLASMRDMGYPDAEILRLFTLHVQSRPSDGKTGPNDSVPSDSGRDNPNKEGSKPDGHNS